MTAQELCDLLKDFCRQTPSIRGRPVYDGEIILALKPDGSGVLEATLESVDHVPGPDHPGIVGAMLDEPSEVAAEFADVGELEQILRGTIGAKWLFFGEIEGDSQSA